MAGMGQWLEAFCGAYGAVVGGAQSSPLWWHLLAASLCVRAKQSRPAHSTAASHMHCAARNKAQGMQQQAVVCSNKVQGMQQQAVVYSNKAHAIQPHTVVCSNKAQGTWHRAFSNGRWCGTAPTWLGVILIYILVLRPRGCTRGLFRSLRSRGVWFTLSVTPVTPVPSATGTMYSGHKMLAIWPYPEVSLAMLEDHVDTHFVPVGHKLYQIKMVCKRNLDLRCVLISDPSTFTLGAGAKARLESSIKKF